MSARRLTQNLACVSLPRSARREPGALRDGAAVPGWHRGSELFSSSAVAGGGAGGSVSSQSHGCSPAVPSAVPPWGLAGETRALREPSAPASSPRRSAARTLCPELLWPIATNLGENGSGNGGNSKELYQNHTEIFFSQSQNFSLKRNKSRGCSASWNSRCWRRQEVEFSPFGRFHLLTVHLH